MAYNPVLLEDFIRLIKPDLDAFLAASREFGLPLSALADMVERAFAFELAFIENALQTFPSQREILTSFLTDLSRCLQEIQAFRDRNRHVKEFFNHLSAVAESVVALSWVTLERTPVQFIRDMKEAGDYFGNRVLSANRGNPQHLNWWNKWTAVMKALEEYVKRHHLTGFTYAVEGRRDPNIPAGPPLPPGPPPEPLNVVGAAGDADQARNALLNEINQGVGITQMLRPVRRQARDLPVRPEAGDPGYVVPKGVRPEAGEPGAQQIGAGQLGAEEPVGAQQHEAGDPGAPQADAGQLQAPVAAQRPAAPPETPHKFALEGRKWRVEHFKKTMGLKVVANEMSETLAMFKCEISELEVQNKINGATIDNCKRCTVVFRDVISTVELIRCQRMIIQCIGHVPSINLDHCDSVQIFLSKNSLDTEIITSKTSSLNVCLLSDDGDYVEIPVPEQIKTTVVNGSLQSSIVQQI